MKYIMKMFFSLLCVLAFIPCNAQTKKFVADKFNCKMDSIANYGIKQNAFPGCQVVVAQYGKIVFNKCYGVHSDKVLKPVKATDIYDLASVTKATATTLSIMKLYEDGKLKLKDKASDFLPFLRNTDKENITVQDLLFHESGLPMSTPFYYKAIEGSSVSQPLTVEERDESHPWQLDTHLFISRYKYKKDAFSKQRDSKHNLHVYDNIWFADCYMDTLKKDVAKIRLGEHRYAYSDLGFITLQWIVEAITGQSLSDYVEKNFYLPMGANHTLFLPARKYKNKDIIPTVQNDRLRGIDEMCGYTQDELASFMGGIAGEAGLYSNATDLALIFQMYLNRGVINGHRYLKDSTCKLFETRQSEISNRGLGFDRPDPKDKNNFSPLSTFGHGGFTGTNVWVDPYNKLVYVFLTNRVSPYPWNNKFMDLGIYGMFQRALYDSFGE